MAVKIGHAHSDENNRASGGLAGDQTSGEVVVQNWYNREKGWATVFRAKDSKIAEKIAVAMEQACTNNNIGYDQGQRTTLYLKASELGWDITKIITKCECDCSSLVAVCVNAAGIKISKDMYTGNQKALLQNTNKFVVFEDKKYLTNSEHLKRGDILLGPGHTAIVLSDGSKTKGELVVDTAKNFSASLIGTYKVTATNLNVRAGAGVSKKVIVAIPKGTKVKCFGYYTEVLSVNWLYIQFTYKNTIYTGFASARYLVK